MVSMPLPRRLAELSPVAVAALLLLVASCAAEPDAVRVLVGGDVHGEPPVAGVLARGDEPLEGVAPHLEDADLVVVNLETPVGPGGQPAEKDFLFRADPALLARLAAAGVDVVNLANNHALDHGPDVLARTVAAAHEAGLVVVGAGSDDAAAWSPAVVEVAGRRVAVLGMTDVVPDASWVAGEGWGVANALDHDRAVEAVTAASESADHVVVTVHWGEEFRECPSVVQVELARRLAAAGADAVVGHHPHVVQGLQTITAGDRTTPVAYSVGNLLFYAATEVTRDAALLELALSPVGVEASPLPIVLDADGAPRVADAESGERITERIRRRSPGGGTCPAAVWDGLPGRR
jgi:poly-gamma-glutamate synthesis protein (capsule biosynthesis protein)